MELQEVGGALRDQMTGVAEILHKSVKKKR